MLKSLINEYREEPSELDASLKVIVTRRGDGAYRKVKHNFSKYGNAFLDIDTRKMYIDGENADREEWTKDHFLFAEAHEIAHLRLNHEGGNVDEAYTDLYAILYLDDKGHDDAADIGISQFEYRNNISFKEYVDKINGK